MALTSITKDFVVKSGALIEGVNIVTSSTAQTGTLQVTGGAAIAKNLVVGTTATVWGATNLNGNLTVIGASSLGLVSAGATTASSLTVTNNGSVGGIFTATGATFLGNILNVSGNALFNGAVNTFSGALFVTGTNIFVVGTGASSFGGTVGIAGVTSITNNTTANSAGNTGALVVTGGTVIGDNLAVKSVAFNTATNTANAIYTAGGIYADKGLTVAGPTLFKDTVTFAGTATYVFSTNTFYTDNIIEVHTPPAGVYTPWFVDDGKDIGLRFHYYTNSTDTNAALVLANDTKYLEWYGSGAEANTGTFGGATYGTFQTGNVYLQGTQNATSTNTGALRVVGGIGVAGAIYSTNNIRVASATVASLTTASGIVFSDASSNLVNTNVLWNSATQQLNGTIYYAGTATHVTGGASGSLVYQTAQSQTTTLPIGSNGYILSVSGGLPTWTAISGLSAGNATTSTNIAGGVKDQIPYQSGVGQTTFSGSTYGLAYNGTYFTTTNIVVTSNNNATAATGLSGALMVTGGVGISRDLWVGGDINVNGSIFLKGAGLDTITSTTGTFVNLIVTGTNATNSAVTGAVQITGGVGVGGGLFVGGIVTATLFSGTATSVQTTQQLANATYYPTLVDSNNATVGGEFLYTTSSFSINPQTGAITHAGAVSVGGTLTVTGYSTLGMLTATIFTATSANIIGNETVGGTLSVTGRTTLGDATAAGFTATTANITGNETVGGTLIVTGYTQMTLLTATTFTATTANITGNETVGGTLGVTGRATLGDATAAGFTATTVNVTGNETVGGTLTVTGYSTLGMLTATIFTATRANIIGNETVGGTLGVTGRTTLGDATATGFTATTVNVTGNETVGGTLGVTGRTTLVDANISSTLTATNLVVTGSATLPSVVTLTALTVTNLTVSNNETIGQNLSVGNWFTATGASVFGSTIAVTGIATFNSTQDSNATNNGSIVTLGGVGVAKNLVVGSAVTVGTVSTQTVVPAVYSNNSLISSYTSGYIVNNTSQNLDTFSSTAYRTAKYIVQVVDGTKIHVEEILVFHDGTNVYMTEYGISTSQGELGTFDANLTGSTVTLTFQANYTPTSMTIKVNRTTITL